MPLRQQTDPSYRRVAIHESLWVCEWCGTVIAAGPVDEGPKQAHARWHESFNQTAQRADSAWADTQLIG